MVTMNITETLSAILDGTFSDDDISAIKGAIQTRKESAGRLTFLTLRIGDKATLKNLRPLYLIGAPVTVVKKNQSRVVVRIDSDWADAHAISYKWRGEITAPAGMLELANDESAAAA